jgi:hypothetical protein
VLLVFDQSPVLPSIFVCCLRLPKLWRNFAFPFLCFNLPLSSPEFFVWFLPMFFALVFGSFSGFFSFSSSVFVLWRRRWSWGTLAFSLVFLPLFLLSFSLWICVFFTLYLCSVFFSSGSSLLSPCLCLPLCPLRLLPLPFCWFCLFFLLFWVSFSLSFSPVFLQFFFPCFCFVCFPPLLVCSFSSFYKARERGNDLRSEP